jgi:hypothetical protein
MNLALVGNSILRSAIQRNLVSFPSQIPALAKRDSQGQIVLLYFVRRWPIRAICNRYGLTKATVQKLLSEWRTRAVSSGYIQDIHPEVIAMLAGEEIFRQQEVCEESEPDSEIPPSRSGWEMTLPPKSHHVVSDAGRF